MSDGYYNIFSVLAITQYATVVKYSFLLYVIVVCDNIYENMYIIYIPLCVSLQFIKRPVASEKGKAVSVRL